MKSNIKRRSEIFKNVMPSKGTKAFEEFKEYNENRVQSSEEKKFFRDCFKKAHNSLEAQYFSHCGLITEVTLRHFLNEFNTRAWNHGLRSMPILFNILESFFSYRKPHIYFELLEEENYLISLFDFLDFITSGNFHDNKSHITENLAEDVIYNFNVGVDLDEISFKTNEGTNFTISGISIVRRENEVTVLLNTGSDNHKIITNTEIQLDTDNPNKKELLEEFKSSNKKEQNPIYIDKEQKLSKVLVACRIDLDTNTIDVRYVAEEYEDMFRINTDDIDGFTDFFGNYHSEDLRTAHEKGIKEVDGFSAIIEVAKLSLYLPYYLNVNEDKLIEETHETEFKSQISNPVSRRKFKDTFGFKAATKPLYVLNVNNKFSPDILKLRDDQFRIESSGYWKKLEQDEVGMDKKGNSIHGRTWVNKKLSWYESKSNELIIQKEKEKYKSKNAGYVYVLRNPTMEKDIFKIGLTRNEVDDRAKQLSKTSVPDKFYKAQEWYVADCVEAERIIHEQLVKYRVDPRREFFSLEYQLAVETISKVCNEINKNAAQQYA